MQKEVLSQNPRLVIVLLGGNDHLRRSPLEETRKNLEAIVEAVRRQGAGVALISPLGKYDAAYKSIAKKHGCIFIPSILKDILNNPKYKSDYIHPNSRGYKIMAERIFEEIKPYL